MKKSKEKKLQDINKEERRLSELHRLLLLATDQGENPFFCCLCCVDVFISLHRYLGILLLGID